MIFCFCKLFGLVFFVVVWLLFDKIVFSFFVMLVGGFVFWVLYWFVWWFSDGFSIFGGFFFGIDDDFVVIGYCWGI